jgi:hypothetical protein
MRTDEEILERIKIRKAEANDLLGTEVTDLIIRLNFGAATPFLNEGVTKDAFEPAPRDRESLIDEMREYMEFAIGKAQDERGISAYRSLAHYAAWTWLAGDDLGDLTSYDNYGLPQLKKICEHYGFDHFKEV